MTKAFAFLFSVMFLAACNSSSSNTSSADSSHMNTQEVQNVNGNIPDTSNSIPINGTGNRKDTDSTYMDTARKMKH